MKTQFLRHTTLVTLSLFFLVFLTSCENDDEQTTNPPPENIITESSQIVKLMSDTAQNSIDDIGCIAFQYPITFSIYNTQFQIANTVSVKSDVQLINFLKSLSEFSVVSLNYPITLIVKDQERVLNNNKELTKLLSTPQNCDVTPDNCSLDSDTFSLVECHLYIAEYNDQDIYKNYRLNFGRENNDLKVLVLDNVMHSGTYSLEEKDGTIILNIKIDWDVINGTWSFLNCDKFSGYTLSRDQSTMRIQGCSYTPAENPFTCFEDFSNQKVCDEESDNKEPFDLTKVNSECFNSDLFKISYHTTESDAQKNSNPIQSPTEYIITSKNTKIYSRVQSLANNILFQINEIKLSLSPCSTTPCTLDGVRNMFWECPIRIVSRNKNQLPYRNHLLVFENKSDDFTIYIEGKVSSPGGYQVKEKADGTFTITFNTDIPNFDGTWDIADCNSFEDIILTRNSDQDEFYLQPKCD